MLWSGIPWMTILYTARFSFLNVLNYIHHKCQQSSCSRSNPPNRFSLEKANRCLCYYTAIIHVYQFSLPLKENLIKSISILYDIDFAVLAGRISLSIAAQRSDAGKKVVIEGAKIRKNKQKNHYTEALSRSSGKTTMRPG